MMEAAAEIIQEDEAAEEQKAQEKKKVDEIDEEWNRLTDQAEQEKSFLQENGFDTKEMPL